MSVFEATLIAILALWTTASVGYCFRNPRWHAFRRWNHQFRACSSWRLFSSDDDEVHSGILELDYLDRSSSGQTSSWATVRDSCWSWHAFLWMPERRVANRTYHLIRELAACLPSDPPADRTLPLPAQSIAHALCRRDPFYAGEEREFRLVVRHRTGVSSLETIYSFTVGPDGTRR